MGICSRLRLSFCHFLVLVVLVVFNFILVFSLYLLLIALFILLPFFPLLVFCFMFTLLTFLAFRSFGFDCFFWQVVLILVASCLHVAFLRFS